MKKNINAYENFKSVVLKTFPDVDHDALRDIFDRLSSTGIRESTAGTLLAKALKKYNKTLEPTNTTEPLPK